MRFAGAVSLPFSLCYGTICNIIVWIMYIVQNEITGFRSCNRHNWFDYHVYGAYRSDIYVIIGNAMINTIL